jgi:hypothetical protein
VGDTFCRTSVGQLQVRTAPSEQKISSAVCRRDDHSM